MGSEGGKEGGPGGERERCCGEEKKGWVDCVGVVRGGQEGGDGGGGEGGVGKGVQPDAEGLDEGVLETRKGLRRWRS